MVVLLDSDAAFRAVESENLDLYWGAYLGTDKEILVSGRTRWESTVYLR